MSRFEKIDKSLDLENLAKHNRNFDRAHADLSSLQQQVSAEQQARMTADNAHTSSTAAHPAERITYSGPVSGARNVKEAIDSQNQRINGIVGQAGNSNSEIVDARAGSDGTAHPVLKARLDRMERRQMEDRDQTTVLNRGMNIVNTTQASGASVQVKGRTLVNILGNDGGCESLAPYRLIGYVSLSSSIKRSGFNSFRLAADGVSSPAAYLDSSYTLDKSKHYIIVYWAYMESYTSGDVGVRISNKGATASNYESYVNKRIIGSWQLLTVKIPVNNTLEGTGFTLGIRNAGSASGPYVCYFDDIRLYEVSAADYAAIGTTITGDAIDAYLPYVDGVEHLKGASVSVVGRNLYSGGITGSTTGGTYNEYPDKLEVESNGAAGVAYTFTKRYAVMPNTDYTLSCVATNLTGPDLPRFSVRKSDGSAFANPIAGAGKQSQTFNTGNETEISVYFYSSNPSQVVQRKRYENIQLELGPSPSEYKKHLPQYAHCPVPLANNIDRTIADSYDSATGQVFRRYRVGYKLDGTLSWLGAGPVGGTALKRITIANFSNISTGIRGHILGRYDGMPLKEGSTSEGAANTFMSHTNGSFYINVLNSDTGWTEALNPNVNAIKAYMNGWKANANNGTNYTSWVSILTGSVPVTNTEAFVAANKAPGWDAWATLDYVLATPVIEQLSGDLGGLALDAGGNTVELLEGVIVREKATLHASVTEYFINGNTASKPKYRVNNIISVHGGSTGKWDILRRSTLNEDLGWGYAKIPANAYDGSDVYVTYVVLDRHLFTSNAIDAVLTYQSTLGGSVAQSIQDIAALKQHDGVQDWILAHYAARLLALEEA